MLCTYETQKETEILVGEVEARYCLVECGLYKCQKGIRVAACGGRSECC